MRSIIKQKHLSGTSDQSKALEVSRNRLAVTLIVFSFAFFTLIIRLFELNFWSPEDIRIGANKSNGGEFFLERSDIVDRNGAVIAVNLATASLYANPKHMDEPHLAAQKLCKSFSSIKCDEVSKQFNSEKNFVWIKRHLTPKEQNAVNHLGIPGLYFAKDEKRVYPQANLFSHPVGYVDVDGNGLAGLEKFHNDSLINNNSEFLQLSLDTRVQAILKDELEKSVKENMAVGASGIVMDATNGEIIAMVSLPDFDPHHVNKTSERQRFNQTTLGVYEMGSTFKLFTFAMGLDSGSVRLNDAFNVEQPIKIGAHRIRDYKGKGGDLSVPEILMYSSNIGTAHIAEKVGAKRQQSYLDKMGMLSSLETDIPERSRPIFPSQQPTWSDASMTTISFGHGIAVTPLHVAAAMAAIVNGGTLYTPTLKKITEGAPQGTQVISAKTSNLMRKLSRLVVTDGYGKKANAAGYLVGGKTGTAEKVSGKGYNKKANIASFVGAFPMNDPKYVILTMIDEAQPTKSNFGFTTGGMIAAPVAGQTIERIAPILGIYPVDEESKQIKQNMYVNYKARYNAVAKAR